MDQHGGLGQWFLRLRKRASLQPDHKSSEKQCDVTASHPCGSQPRHSQTASQFVTQKRNSIVEIGIFYPNGSKMFSKQVTILLLWIVSFKGKFFAPFHFFSIPAAKSGKWATFERKKTCHVTSFVSKISVIFLPGLGNSKFWRLSIDFRRFKGYSAL